MDKKYKGLYWDELPKAEREKVYRPHYKQMMLDQRNNNKVLLGFCLVSTLFSVLTICGAIKRNESLVRENLKFRDDQKVAMRMLVEYDTLVQTYAQHLDSRDHSLTQCLNKLPKPKVVKGKVSYYSKDGCIGCNARQVMSNGEVFDETKYTIACNQLPLNTIVRVKNLENGLFVTAKVTDRGGFEKYGRIADLSKATCEAINCKTDKTNVEITQL